MHAISTISDLISSELLPASYIRVVENFWRPLAHQIAAWRRDKGRPVAIGINGAQGSGKSTLTTFLAKALLPELGLSTTALSLDDFYLPKADRQILARTKHPLFAVRGVPGTHDINLLFDALSRLLAGEMALSVPAFNKACDDRAPAPNALCLDAPADVVLLEGWCIGASPQSAAALVQPVNSLEEQLDPNAVWRHAVNEYLKDYDQRIFSYLEYVIMLKAPNFETIIENRRLQERKLRARDLNANDLMSDEKVVTFVQHYERLTRHMLAEMPSRAGVGFNLNDIKRIQSSTPTQNNNQEILIPCSRPE